MAQYLYTLLRQTITMATFDDDIGPMAYLMCQRVVVSTPSLSSTLMEAMKIAGRTINSIPVPAIIAERTSLEKQLLVVAGLYLGWQAHRNGVATRLSRVAGWVAPGYNWLKTRLGYFSIELDPMTATSRLVLESRRDGSEEQVMTSPRCQCKIGRLQDGVFSVLGCAIRFEGDYLVSPDHVMGGDDLEEKFVLGVQGLVSLRGKERLKIATDMVAVKVTATEAARIGAQICVLGGLKRTTYAQIVGPFGKGTTGVLKDDPWVFGRLVYEGTTIGGYSGAAYMSGNQVIGLHQCGGHLNGGYSATYIWTNLKSALRQFSVSEETGDFLRGQYNAGKKMRWSTTGDPSYVQVQVDGIYTMVTKEGMDKAFGRDWQNSEVIQRGYDRVYDDNQLESVSGESNRSKCPGASSIVGKSQELERQDPLDVIAAFKRLSTDQQQDFRRLLQTPKQQKKSTNGQASQVPQGN